MGRKPIGRVPTGVTLDPDMIEWLNHEADERRVSVSQIIRELILREMVASRISSQEITDAKT